MAFSDGWGRSQEYYSNNSIWLWFPRFPNVFQLVILQGGLSFIAVKGVFKIYLRRKQFLRQLKRKVLNYGDEINEDEEFAQYGEDQE